MVSWGAQGFIFCTLLCMFTIYCEGAGATIKCYVCHFNPNDAENDTCTPPNFKPHLSMSFECKFGCETVTEKDNNGQFVAFYRNCAPENKSQMNPGECRTNQFKALSREVCLCNTKLCNSHTAESSRASQGTFIFQYALIFNCVFAIGYIWWTRF